MQCIFHNAYIFTRACIHSSDFLDKAQLLTQIPINQGYIAPGGVKSSLQNVYGRHHDLVYHYEIAISQMTMDLSPLLKIFFLYH